MKKIALIAGLAVSSAALADIRTHSPVHPNEFGQSGRDVRTAAVLWSQPPTSGNNFVDQNFSDFPTFATFIVTDVSFATGVVIEDVITYFTRFGGNWPVGGSGTATLNIFSKTGASPGAGDDPFSGVSVPVDFLASATGIDVHASGLNIALPAGDYWIGLTPNLAFAGNGQEFHLEAARIGDLSHARNPGGGFGFGTGWILPSTVVGVYEDAAITILGIPAPGTVAMLGLGGLLAARRRR